MVEFARTCSNFLESRLNAPKSSLEPVSPDFRTFRLLKRPPNTSTTFLFSNQHSTYVATLREILINIQDQHLESCKSTFLESLTLIAEPDQHRVPCVCTWSQPQPRSRSLAAAASQQPRSLAGHCLRPVHGPSSEQPLRAALHSRQPHSRRSRRIRRIQALLCARFAHALVVLCPSLSRALSRALASAPRSVLAPSHTHDPYGRP